MICFKYHQLFSKIPLKLVDSFFGHGMTSLTVNNDVIVDVLSSTLCQTSVQWKNCRRKDRQHYSLNNPWISLNDEVMAKPETIRLFIHVLNIIQGSVKQLGTHYKLFNSVADPEFPVGGRGLPRRLRFEIFVSKQKNRDPWGRAPGTPPRSASVIA